MQKILTGGVDITKKEMFYIADAVANGWDFNHDYYKVKFEKEFARYVGVKYAYAVTGGTQALWLSLKALGIGYGDEVIIPELTYFACSDVVKLVDANPIFVDIDPISWCINPNKIEQAITSKTKAIMPVYSYGSSPDMDKIMAIAKKHKLHVIEDACPAVGTLYKGKHAGTFGNTGCFSFHGAKIMTTGFGGMVVTDDKRLYDYIVFLDDHGGNKGLDIRFWQEEVGFSFYLHNINAALGLAQLERIEEFVAKKNKIFSWYRKYLKDDRLELTHKQKDVRSNCWLFSIILKNTEIDRDRLIEKLKEEGIDTRPFFYPLSFMPLYRKRRISPEDGTELNIAPVADEICLNGINLPTGVQRTEEEIKFICDTIKKLI